MVDVLDVKVIAIFTIKVAIVEVSTKVVEVSANVTIARYRYLFMLVVKAAVVKVSVVNPVPLATSDHETEASAVVVSVATCHFTVLEKGDATKVVPIVNESVSPAVVVSFVGWRDIRGNVINEKIDPRVVPLAFTAFARK